MIYRGQLLGKKGHSCSSSRVGQVQTGGAPCASNAQWPVRFDDILIGWSVRVAVDIILRKAAAVWGRASPATHNRWRLCHRGRSSGESIRSFGRSAEAPWAWSTRRCTWPSDVGLL